MQQPFSYYEEPSQTNPTRIAFAMLLILPISIVLGYAYSGIIIAIPLIYFGIIFPVGIALLISLVVRITAKITHNTNKKSRLLLAVLSGIFFNYFQWTAYILYAKNGTPPNLSRYLSNIDLLLSSETYAFLYQINTIGLWSSFGVPVNGASLGFIWILEIGIILFIPIAHMLRAIPKPYSEQYKKWYPKFTLDEKYKSIASLQKFNIALQDDIYQAINQLELGDARRYTKIHLYYIPDEQKQYIDFERITIDRDNKKDIEPIITGLVLSTTIAKKILANFEHKQTKIDLF